MPQTAGAPLIEYLRRLLRAPDPTDLPERVTESGPAVMAALTELIPEARERQRAAGIPEDAIEAGLRDLARKHELYGADTVAGWLIGVLRGDVVQLGRLQVDRRHGAHGHALHIPESGPLDPATVDASLDRIRRYLGTANLSCTSWLLDPHLSVALPDSNIAAFAARFDRIIADDPAEGDGNAAVAKFVFRLTPNDVLSGRVPEPRTALERVVVTRLRSGPRWTQPVGLLRQAPWSQIPA